MDLKPLTAERILDLIQTLSSLVDKSLAKRIEISTLTAEMDSIKDREEFLKIAIYVEEDTLKSRDLLDDLQRTMDRKRFQNKAMKEREWELDALDTQQINIRDYLRYAHV